MARFAALLVDKPAGPTSHEIVDFVRWALRERSVGHCGTLDPAATGLVVVVLGRATRLSESLSAADKVYEASFALGRSTTTADADGETVDQMEVGDWVWDDCVAALESLEGLHHLPPPAFSAVKVGGVRAHTLARKGGAPELAPRPMQVFCVREARRVGDLVHARLHVSKGSYIRSLALELGRRLGVPAHLAGLRRVACGPAQLDATALTLEATPRPVAAGRPPQWRLRPSGATDRDGCRRAIESQLIDPIELLPMPRFAVDDATATRLLHGKAVQRPAGCPELDPDALVALVGGESSPIRVALAGPGEDGALRPKRVLPRDA